MAAIAGGDDVGADERMVQMLVRIFAAQIAGAAEGIGQL